METARQLCTFYVGDGYFGVDVTRVQEVIRFQQMTDVPLAPKVIEGLINLRGQIVPAVDLRRRLELPPRPEGRLPMNIVIRANEGAVSLLVDDIGDVVEVEASAFETPPETLRGVARTLIPGAYKLADRLVLVLDTERAVTLDSDLT